MNLRNTQSQDARRCAIAEPLVGWPSYDYADAFEVPIDDDDNRAAEQVVRAGVERASRPLLSAALIAHRHVLKFQLGPVSGPDHVMGWRIVVSEHDLCHLEATGPLMEGAIVARRVSTDTARLTTFLRFRRPLARVVWLAVGTVHRRLAPYLMVRAVTTQHA